MEDYTISFKDFMHGFCLWTAGSLLICLIVYMFYELFYSNSWVSRRASGIPRIIPMRRQIAQENNDDGNEEDVEQEEEVDQQPFDDLIHVITDLRQRHQGSSRHHDAILQASMPKAINYAIEFEVDNAGQPEKSGGFIADIESARGDHEHEVFGRDPDSILSSDAIIKKVIVKPWSPD